MLLGAVGLSAVLASCGTGNAPDGSGSGSVTALRTEYRTQEGRFVSCDNYNGALATTQVSVYFNVRGNVQTVDVGLRGRTSNTYDGNYNARFTGQQLVTVDPSGSYRATFNANPAVDGFLPQAIVVNPARAKVKIVAASGRAGNNLNSGFYAALTVNTGTSTYNFDSRNVATVDTYTTCTLISTTNEDV